MPGDSTWDDGASGKGGNLSQMIFIDPKRDFAIVSLSTASFVDGYGEFKTGGDQPVVSDMLTGE